VVNGVPPRRCERRARGRRTISELATDATRTFRHLLLVEGPSGAGKSTFIRQLVAGGLPAEIEARLPAGARLWPVVEADMVDRWFAERRADPSPAGHGVIVHYDILTPIYLDVVGHAQVPFIGLLHFAARVTVVRLREPASRLAARLGWRYFNSRRPLVWRLRLARDRIVGRGLDGVVAGAGALAPYLPARLTRLPAVARWRDTVMWDHEVSRWRRAAARSLAIYCRAGALEAWHRIWDRFLADVRADVEIVTVASGEGDGPAWRLEER
jgi:hypothetical protein